MEQQLRRPCLVIPILVFLPALLSCVHGVDVAAHGKDDIGTLTFSALSLMFCMYDLLFAIKDEFAGPHFVSDL